MEESIEVQVTITVMKSEVVYAFGLAGLEVPEDWQAWAKTQVENTATFWNDEIIHDLVNAVHSDVEQDPTLEQR